MVPSLPRPLPALLHTHLEELPESLPSLLFHMVLLPASSVPSLRPRSGSKIQVPLLVTPNSSPILSAPAPAGLASSFPWTPTPIPADVPLCVASPTWSLACPLRFHLQGCYVRQAAERGKAPSNLAGRCLVHKSLDTRR